MKYVMDNFPLDLVKDRKSKVEEKIVKKELFNIVNAHILRLPDFHREVFVLREYQNLPYDEIGKITNTSLSRVKKAMSKAVLILTNQLEKSSINKNFLRDCL